MLGDHFPRIILGSAVGHRLRLVALCVGEMSYHGRWRDGCDHRQEWLGDMCHMAMCAGISSIELTPAWTWLEGWHAFPSFSSPASPTSCPSFRHRLFICDWTTWASQGSIAHLVSESGVNGWLMIPLRFRGAVCTGLTILWSVRRGYYHIGCARESYWP